jgi:hypothetical protein
MMIRMQIVGRSGVKLYSLLESINIQLTAPPAEPKKKRRTRRR